MDIEFFGFEVPHRLGESATHSSGCLANPLAALLLLAGISLLRRHALPSGLPDTHSSASNCRF